MLGVAVAAAIWWIYFDVVALVSARRLAEAEPGRPQNALARDSYTYMHLSLVAGIVLTAFGLEEALAHTDEHLHSVPAFGLLGGIALYLLGLVAFRYRQVRTVNRHRLGAGDRLAAPDPGRDGDPGTGDAWRSRPAAGGDDRRSSTGGYGERRERSCGAKPEVGEVDDRLGIPTRTTVERTLRLRHTAEP